MSREAKDVEGYLSTVDRIEPSIHPIDASAFYASAAISLRRQADAAERSAAAAETAALTLTNILAVLLHR